jgi:pimeloyl-ACP methyl ester carboxylesterase
MPMVSANGAQLYYELRGEGQPLLLIMGASGCGGVFDRLADLLAGERTVVTYDRRGNGRSPPPSSWETTSPQEQADDAAALLDALSLTPAVEFGTSSGGIFALAMLMHHPEAVRGAILHEPALFALFDDPGEARATVTEVVAAGMRAGGLPTAFESFIRFVATDANWEGLDAHVRQRMLASAGTYFEKEIGRFDTYLPDDQALAGISTPVQILVSEGSMPYFAQAAQRLAERLKIQTTPTPGTHFVYLDHPDELAQTVRPFLDKVGS